jgi:hypothetical protein
LFLQSFIADPPAPPLPPAPPAPPPSADLPPSVLTAEVLLTVVPTLSFYDDEEFDSSTNTTVVNTAKTPDSGFGDPSVCSTSIRIWLHSFLVLKTQHSSFFTSIAGLYWIKYMAYGGRHCFHSSFCSAGM